MGGGAGHRLALNAGRLLVCAALAVLLGCWAGWLIPSASPAQAAPAVSQATPTFFALVSTPLSSVETPAPLVTGTATLTGQLLNGTRGTAAPAGLPVTLYALAADLQSVVFTRTAQTDASGLVHFEELDAAPDVLYALVADYQGVIFFSEPQPVQPGQAALSLFLTVYEVTADPSLLRVERLHVILDVQPGSIQVTELWLVSNTGSRVYLEADGTSLRVELPPAASRLQFQDGELGGRYVLGRQGFADSEPVHPGERTHQLLFSFVMAYDNKALEVALPLAYPVQDINVLLPDVGLQLDSVQLLPAGTRETQSGTYLNFTGGPLPAGQVLSFRLAGAMSSPSATAPAAASPWLIGGAALASLAVLAGASWWWRSRQAGPADPEALLGAMAALDDAYQAGQLEEGAYRRERQALKDALLELMADDTH